ncbi:MAG: hypothetical protein IPG56_18685 [Caulobacteraceae bacterium]|nr:hypothetical protein [Caulobacteraceae bacterium]
MRFIDAAKDYLIAGVSARRLDRADGGVATLKRRWCWRQTLPKRWLSASWRSSAPRGAAHRRRPGRVALEPGDRVTFAGGGSLRSCTSRMQKRANGTAPRARLRSHLVRRR